MLYLRKLILFLLALQAKQGADDKNFKPIEEMTGADTLIERPLATMVTKESDWLALWREHKEMIGDPPASPPGWTNYDAPPKVDFQKYVIVVYFGGQGKGVDGYQVVKVDTKGKTNVVQIAPHFFGSTVLSNSYGMWMFPRPKKPVELQLLVDVVNGEPQFRKLGEFAPPKVSAVPGRTGGGS